MYVRTWMRSCQLDFLLTPNLKTVRERPAPHAAAEGPLGDQEPEVLNTEEESVSVHVKGAVFCG